MEHEWAIDKSQVYFGCGNYRRYCIHCGFEQCPCEPMPMFENMSCWARINEAEEAGTLAEADERRTSRPGFWS